MKYLIFMCLSLFSLSCLPSNVRVMPEYSGEKISRENLTIIQTRLDPKGNYNVITRYSSGTKVPVITNDITNLFAVNPQDEITFTPNYLDINDNLIDYSSFVNIYNSSITTIPPLYKRNLYLNSEDSLSIFLPHDSRDSGIISDSIKYILFIQLPNEVFCKKGSLSVGMNFCIWDNVVARIISYGRFDKFSLKGYNLDQEGFKGEIARRIFIETPFYKNNFSRRVKMQKDNSDPHLENLLK